MRAVADGATCSLLHDGTGGARGHSSHLWHQNVGLTEVLGSKLRRVLLWVCICVRVLVGLSEYAASGGITMRRQRLGESDRRQQTTQEAVKHTEKKKRRETEIHKDRDEFDALSRRRPLWLLLRLQQ